MRKGIHRIHIHNSVALTLFIFITLKSGGELGARGKREGLISYVGLVKN